MSLLKPFRPVIPVANNDTSTYYVSMQPVICGKSTSKFVSPKLTFKSSTNEFLLNNSTIGAKNTASGTKPTNPNVGDIWYDTTSDITFQYIFDGLNYFWIDISGVTFGGIIIPPPIILPPTPLGAVQYLVVAGGGGGGGPTNGTTSGSGGGGGGVLTGSTILYGQSVYTIVVGGGGQGGVGVAAPAPGSNPGMAGNNSSISGYGVCGITSRGGGGGAGGNQANPVTTFPVAHPACGGSGGGGYGYNTPINLSRAFGSPGYNVAGSQGYPGGSIPASNFSLASGAGGGGAGGTGGNGNPRGNPAPCFGPAVGNGTGGPGYTWPFTATTYGGGGGGGNFPVCAPSATFGAGGPGGGGRGGGCPTRAVAGTLNTGGGGGGGGAPSGCQMAANGGSGIVILALPLAVYANVSNPGGATISNPPSAPGMTVLSYTSPSRFIDGTFTLTTL
jgi:hypothetical protein